MSNIYFKDLLNSTSKKRSRIRESFFARWGHLRDLKYQNFKFRANISFSRIG